MAKRKKKESGGSTETTTPLSQFHEQVEVSTATRPIPDTLEEPLSLLTREVRAGHANEHVAIVIRGPQKGLLVHHHRDLESLLNSMPRVDGVGESDIWVGQIGLPAEASPVTSANEEEGWVARLQNKENSQKALGPNPTYPDPNVPFSIAHNNQAGVKLLKFERFKQVQLAFSSPISGDIEGELIATGWKYRPEERVYTKQYDESGAGSTMFDAKRLYDKLVERLSIEKSPHEGHGRK